MTRPSLTWEYTAAEYTIARLSLSPNTSFTQEIICIVRQAGQDLRSGLYCWQVWKTCCPAAPPPSSLQLIPDYEALATELCSVFSVYFLIFCKLLKLNTTQPTSAIIFASSVLLQTVCNYSSSQLRPNQLSSTLVILFICKVLLTFK